MIAGPRPTKILRAALALILAADAGVALAQSRVPRIWDVVPGMPIGELPAKEFVEPSCGTKGGPQGLPIGSFGQFRRCPAEADGLREIWFTYDDTAEYAAMARRQPALHKTTAILDQPVILSLLIDPDGNVQGYRIFTDTKAEHDLRLHAHEVALHFKARFGLDGHCTDIPAAPGETPIDGQFVKELCQKEFDGRRITAEARFYYRPGQHFFDPHTGMPMANSFESWARLEMVRTDRSKRAGAAQPAPVPAADRDRVEAFLAGASNDCPGCRLADADLRYRDLTGANLEGADLEGALLHRAVLRRANLAGANLRGANLNRANLDFARLDRAVLFNAMLFQADAQRADFSGADLAEAMMGRINLAFANLERATLDRADLAEGRLTDANLAEASLKKTYMPLAALARAQMPGADASGAGLAEAGLRGANLAGAALRGADFTRADLAGADLSHADLSGARLISADLTDVRTEGANFTRALMPDNSLHR